MQKMHLVSHCQIGYPIIKNASIANLYLLFATVPFFMPLGFAFHFEAVITFFGGSFFRPWDDFEMNRVLVGA